MIINNNIIIRCEFIELLDHLEKINIDYVDINKLNNFIFIDIKKNMNYKISKVINNNETYSFQYNFNNIDINIPNANFLPDIMYDFEIDLINKKFIKKDEFKNIILENHTIINIEDEKIVKKKSIFTFARQLLLGC